MNKPMQQIALAAVATLVGLFTVAHMQAQSVTPAPEKVLADVSITYSALHMNSPVGGCGCFWLSGATAEGVLPVWRYVSAVAELSGGHAGSIPGSQTIGISLISGMGGLRATRKEHRVYYPFVQGLIGGVHAFDSSFPSTTPKATAGSFALAVGGGLDISVHKHWLIRPIQAEYQYMQLPNNGSNEQHDLRLSAGVVYRFYR